MNYFLVTYKHVANLGINISDFFKFFIFYKFSQSSIFITFLIARWCQTLFEYTFECHNYINETRNLWCSVGCLYWKVTWLVLSEDCINNNIWTWCRTVTTVYKTLLGIRNIPIILKFSTLQSNFCLVIDIQVQTMVISAHPKQLRPGNTPKKNSPSSGVFRIIFLEIFPRSGRARGGRSKQASLPLWGRPCLRRYEFTLEIVKFNEFLILGLTNIHSLIFSGPYITASHITTRIHFYGVNKWS